MERIFHTWDKWECYPAGFYATKPPFKDMTTDDCKRAYADFFRDTKRFEAALSAVIYNWPNSCEHYLTNERMNRIAWLGQASMCFETGVSKYFCGGFFLLTPEQQKLADLSALDGLNRWAMSQGYCDFSMEEAASKTQADLY